MRYRVNFVPGRKKELRCHLYNRTGLGCVSQFIVGLRLKSCSHQWLRNDAGKYIKKIVLPEPKALPVSSTWISYQCTSGSMHIKMKFVHYFLMWVGLIFLQWLLASDFERICTDHGPDAQNRHEYTGWHHICRLNNKYVICQIWYPWIILCLLDRKWSFFSEEWNIFW